MKKGASVFFRAVRIEQFGFEPWPGHCVACCVLGQDTLFSVSLFPQEYIWAPANSMLMGNPATD